MQDNSVPSDPVESTLAYYDTRAAEFCARTRDLDMRASYAPFLALLRPGARILDVGCGSGRDSRAFLLMGHEVVSIDGSPAMVAATTSLTGRQALLMRFDEIDFHKEFDGIWACASLLHVSRQDLPGVFRALARALRAPGVLYVSFKRGTGDATRDTRHFTDFDAPALRALVSRSTGLREEGMWELEDARGLEHPAWLNALFSKSP